MLTRLNPTQRDAVVHTDGPLLIIAGAGSGKTRVLTYRIAYLIKEQNVSPYNIIAITFTNKAAKEMKERIGNLVGRMSGVMWTSTFHAACVRILRQDGERLGYSKNFSIYDSHDSNRLITHCLRDLNIDSKQYPANRIAHAISNAKNELIDSETFASRAMSHVERIVADVYKLYQERLFQSNAMDFDDLIMVSVNLLKLFPSVLEIYQERFKYILIDEYQDTNFAQYELIRTLAGKHRNLCVVGDEDQSIYKFRGADIRNILEFEADYPDCCVIKLEQNYRSTKNILSAANEVMQNNRSRKPKALWTENESGSPIIRYQGENEHEEATFVASEIEQLSKRGAYYKDCAIFYRTNAQSRVLEEMFLRYGVPYKIVGGLKFYDRAEIKDVLAYLRVLSNPQDAVSLKRIINVPRRGLGDTTIAKIDSFALKNNIGFSSALRRMDEIHTLSTAAVKNLKKFLAMMDELLEVKEKVSRAKSEEFIEAPVDAEAPLQMTLDASINPEPEPMAGTVNDMPNDAPVEIAAMEPTVENLVRAMLDATGYLAVFEADGTMEAANRAENVKEFIGVIKEFEDSRVECTLDEFLEEISLVADIDSLDDEQDAVTMMTVHNAKGLEFNNVFIVGLEEGVFPHIRSMTDPSEIEEERRLFYVGVTRAMQKLHLCNAWSRNLWGGLNYNSPSRFLAEIPQELLQDAIQADTKAILPSEIGEFAPGDNVYHQKFGAGRVLSVKNADQVTVLFAGEGEKTLLLKFAPLEKR